MVHRTGYNILLDHEPINVVIAGFNTEEELESKTVKVISDYLGDKTVVCEVFKKREQSEDYEVSLRDQYGHLEVTLCKSKIV